MHLRLRRLAPTVLASTLLLSACSEDISSREVMLETLQDQGTLTAEQAECVATVFFDGDEYTQDDLDKVASGFTNDDGSEKVPGFQDFAAEAIKGCV